MTCYLPLFDLSKCDMGLNGFIFQFQWYIVEEIERILRNLK